MTEPLTPSVGWGVLHLFWKVGASVDAEAAVAAIKSCEADEHQVITFAALGHKADLGTMAFGPDLWRLRRLQTELTRSGLELVDSYVSFTEVSEYAKGMSEEMSRPRLYPSKLPPAGMRSVCFYPMSKRRGVGADDVNWFTLPYEDRSRLMHEHGASGRKFAGRITQLITGSTGVDDFEWGVTLFAHDPADLKEVVYTMRFDEASAAFGEFGQFVSGMIDTPETVLAELTR
jgi:hydrogen peroxide-dependent heme synthase